MPLGMLLWTTPEGSRCPSHARLRGSGPSVPVGTKRQVLFPVDRIVRKKLQADDLDSRGKNLTHPVLTQPGSAYMSVSYRLPTL